MTLKERNKVKEATNVSSLRYLRQHLRFEAHLGSLLPIHNGLQLFELEQLLGASNSINRLTDGFGHSGSAKKCT